MTIWCPVDQRVCHNTHCRDGICRDAPDDHKEPPMTAVRDSEPEKPISPTGIGSSAFVHGQWVAEDGELDRLRSVNAALLTACEMVLEWWPEMNWPEAKLKHFQMPEGPAVLAMRAAVRQAKRES